MPDYTAYGACPKSIRVPCPLAHADIVRLSGACGPLNPDGLIDFACRGSHAHDGPCDLGDDYTRFAFLADTLASLDRPMTGVAAGIYLGADEVLAPGKPYFAALQAAWEALEKASDATYAELLALVERRAKFVEESMAWNAAHGIGEAQDVYVLFEKETYADQKLTKLVVCGVYRERTDAQAAMQARVASDTRCYPCLTSFEAHEDRVSYSMPVDESLGVGCTGYVIRRHPLR